VSEVDEGDTRGSRCLVMLDAIAENDRVSRMQEVIEGDAWVVMYAGKQSQELRDLLHEAGGTEQLCDCTKVESLYKKGWWSTGDKHLCKGVKWSLWRSEGIPQLEWGGVRGTDAVPWMEAADEEREDLEIYLNGIHRGAMRREPGRKMWTDGSFRLVGGIPSAGAGWVDENGNSGSCRIGGIATIMRAEMGAAAKAVKHTPLDMELTLFTDSLALVWILRRWTRGDFGFWMDREQHADILEDLLQSLRERTDRGTRTRVVWTKAHAGNIGNEVADTMAYDGCVIPKSRAEWDREETDVRMRRPPTTAGKGEILSWRGWSRAVTKAAVQFVGECTRSRLEATGTAISTQSLVKKGRGRRFMGAALASEEVSPIARRDMLQARSFAFPTASVVARYTDASPDCIYCKKRTPETFGHLQCECTYFDGVRRVAHNIVADLIVDEIAKRQEGAIAFTDTAMARLFPGCPERVALLKPDGIIINRDKKRIYVIEFTRGIRDEPEDWQDKKAEKHNKYHGIRILLQQRYPGFRISQGTFIMGVLGTVDEEDWEEQLESMGVKDTEYDAIMRRCVRGGVLALNAVTTARRAATEEMRASAGKEGFDRSKRPRVRR
jgi:ribonuclease HI